MVFGIFIDVPIVVGGYFLMLRYRRQLTDRFAWAKIPSLALGVLLSIPLIILEEQINCMPAWCGTVLVPPTLTFLLIEVFALSLLSLGIHAKNAFHVVSLYSVFGVFFEATVGGLVGAGFLITLIFAPYVWISYGFISLLPISILIENQRASMKNPQTGTIDSSVTASPRLS